MGLRTYECRAGHAIQTLRDPPDACPECGEPLKRRLGRATHQVMERLDNGVLPRAVERWADAEEVWRRHSRRRG